MEKIKYEILNFCSQYDLRRVSKWKTYRDRAEAGTSQVVEKKFNYSRTHMNFVNYIYANFCRYRKFL